MEELRKQKQEKYKSLGFERADKLEERLLDAHMSAIVRHWSWYEIDEFLRNNHWVQYDVPGNSIFRNAPEAEADIQTKLTVPLLYSAYRTLKGFITRGNRGISAIPIAADGSQVSQQQAADLSEYAYYLLRELKVGLAGGEAVEFGLRHSLGATKVYWDSQLHNGKGFFAIKSVDSFNMYFDPSATSPYESSYIIEVSRKKVSDLKNNPNYKNTEQVTADGMISYSAARTLELEIAYPSIANPVASGDETVLVKEMYEKIWNKSESKFDIAVTTVANGVELRHDPKTEFDEYPYVFYRTDHNPQEVYGEGAMKNVVEINRVIDRIESQVADYNNVFMKGTYRTTRGSHTRVMTNVAGKIFETVPGTTIDQMPMQPLPSTPFQQMENWMGYYQSATGIQQALIGEKPEGTRSGAELEQLSEAAANNLSDYIKNYDLWLEDLFTHLFKLAAKHYITARPHAVGNIFGNLIIKNFISDPGGKKSRGEQKENTVFIPDNIHVIIAPDNLLGMTVSGRFNRIMQLLNMPHPILDAQAALEMLQVQGFEGIVARMEAKQQQEKQQEQQMQQEQLFAQQQAKAMPVPPKVNFNIKGVLDPNQTGEVLETQGMSAVPGLPGDVTLAMNENHLMMSGQDVPPTQHATSTHTQAHIEFMQGAQFQNAGHQIDQLFVNHVQGEMHEEEMAKQKAFMAIMADDMQRNAQGEKNITPPPMPGGAIPVPGMTPPGMQPPMPPH